MESHDLHLCFCSVLRKLLWLQLINWICFDGLCNYKLVGFINSAFKNELCVVINDKQDRVWVESCCIIFYFILQSILFLMLSSSCAPHKEFYFDIRHHQSVHHSHRNHRGKVRAWQTNERKAHLTDIVFNRQESVPRSHQNRKLNALQK